MLNGDIDTVELEGQIVSTVSLEGDLLPIGPKGDKGDDGFSPVVTTSKSGKTTTIKFETATGNVYAYVQDGEDGQGSGDMLTDVYDQNKNGIVDNAEACNGHTLAKDVPADAVFTDTTYESKEAASGGSDVSLCTTGEKYTWNNKSDFSGSYNDLTNKPTIPTKTSDLTNDSGFINNTVNNLTNYTPTSSLSTVALTGSYSDLSNKPSIPSKTSDLTNDSGFIDKTVNDLTNYYKKSDTYTKTEANTLLGEKANSSDLATVATSGSYNDLSNKPTIPDELADLSDDSTHRLVSDAEKTIWNNKVDSTGDATTTGENTSFSLTNVLEAPLLIDLKGNTNQNTLSGKNLFNQNNVSWIRNNVNNYISTTNDNATRIRIQSPIKLEEGKTYTISGIPSGISLGVVKFYTNNSTTDNTYVNTKTFTIPTGRPNVIFQFNGENFTDSTNTLMQNADIQVELGNQATAYEEYCGGIPSPNPSYPQNVNVVSGDNDIKITGKNLCGYNIDPTTSMGFNFNCENGQLSIDGTSSGSGVVYNSVYNSIKIPAGSYRVSSTILDGSFTANDKDVAIYFVRGDTIRFQMSKGNNYTADISLSENKDTEYYMRISTNGSGFKFNNLKIGLQITKGTTSTDYEPYNGTTYNIDLPVENLIDYDNMKATGGYGNDGYLPSNTNYTTIQYIPVIPNTTYTLYTDIDITKYIGLRVSDFNSSKTFIRRNATIGITSQTQTFKTSSDAVYIALSFWTSGTASISDITQAQLELGTKANSYTPYGTTPIELCKIGTYQDYFYKEDDKWYLHKEVGKVVLNGSENWLDRSAGGRQYFTIAGSTHKREGLCFANYYGFINSISTSIDYGIRLGGAEFTQIVNVDITSVADFKTWLGTHNTIVYYVLATPTNTEITYAPLVSQLDSIYEAQSKEGITNINQVNNDLPFIIDATAFNNNYNGRYRSLKYMYDKISTGGNN